jgi:hypothetical protein
MVERAAFTLCSLSRSSVRATNPVDTATGCNVRHGRLAGPRGVVTRDAHWDPSARAGATACVAGATGAADGMLCSLAPAKMTGPEPTPEFRLVCPDTSFADVPRTHSELAAEVCKLSRMAASTPPQATLEPALVSQLRRVASAWFKAHEHMPMHQTLAHMITELLEDETGGQQRALFDDAVYDAVALFASRRSFSDFMVGFSLKTEWRSDKVAHTEARLQRNVFVSTADTALHQSVALLRRLARASPNAWSADGPCLAPEVYAQLVCARTAWLEYSLSAGALSRISQLFACMEDVCGGAKRARLDALLFTFMEPHVSLHELTRLMHYGGAFFADRGGENAAAWHQHYEARNAISGNLAVHKKNEDDEALGRKRRR